MLATDKKGILIVSFGTCYHDTREKTIDKIEEDISTNYPDYNIYHAWTSKMIINKLLKRDNIIINTVSEAMESIVNDGITQLLVQPTHILNGIENDIMKDDVLAFKNHFSKIRFGDPLLSTDEDNVNVINALMQEHNDLSEDEALVFMGHGTTHYSNSVYAALDYTCKDLGYNNVFFGTVEAYPSVDTLLKHVKAHQPKKIRLVPFMVVAGDHATNDLAGDEEDSWKILFEREGYKVNCVLQGIGELDSIRQIYLEHLEKILL